MISPVPRFLFLLLLHCWGSYGLEYGPPLDFLIPAGGGQPKEIALDGYDPSFSVTLPLTNASSSALVSQVHPQGQFIVLAPQGHGIMVVIQNLRLRTSVVPSPHQHESAAYSLTCRDLLTFSAGNQTKQVCGHVLKQSKEANPPGLLGPRTYITSEQSMTVFVFVDAGHANNDYGWHETISAEITITAFKPCPKNGFVSQIKKWAGRNPLRSCSPSEDKVCVHFSTLCDGVGNCGVKGPLGHIGFDEENCGTRRNPSPSETPFLQAETATTPKTPYIGVNKPYTPPTTGKVISPIHLILIFSIVVLILFGGCTWLAKANDKKFQHTVYRFSTMRRNRRSGNNQPARSNNHTPTIEEDSIGRRPSAPPVSATNTLAPSNREDVEEPPPYEHLFPSAPPQTTP